jgi:exodeoxyribonuclease VII large subunit
MDKTVSREPAVLRVSELNAHLKQLLGGLGRIAVEGEVASLRRPASGHLYFNLKDRRRGIESVLGCAIWRSQTQRALKQELVEGDQVIAHGKLDVYAPRGTYSLIVDRVEAVGLGALLVKLEELKRELAQLGWFDRKRPLPRLPRMVGVVTSRDGAAFQDFLRTRSMRWPLFPVRLRHTPVQGPGAAEEIARAVEDLDRSGVDVIVLCRGGGSLEDLWSFNERPVAEAIWRTSVPVVCGVGHETDATLADLVADHRAHTPTDAAQTVIPDRRELSEGLERAFGDLVDAVEAQIAWRSERLEQLLGRRHLRSADWILEGRVEALGRLGRQLRHGASVALERATGVLRTRERELAVHAPLRRLERAEAQVAALGQRLLGPPREGLAGSEARLELARGRLEAFSPYAVLGRGYSITRAVGGAPLLDASTVEPGTEVETLLCRGRLRSTVGSVELPEDVPEGSA